MILLAAGFLAFSGAFGSGPAPLGLRMLYWVAAIAAGAGVEAALDAWVFGRNDWIENRPWRGGLIRTLAIAVPTTGFAWALFALMFNGGRFQPALLADFLLPVLAVTAGMVVLTTLVTQMPQTTHRAHTLPQAPTAPPPQARLLQRLPPRLRGATLFAVEAEDHYLRLHTSRGSDLILLRLADALDELDGIEGARVHRSWWVARDAVLAAEREDGRTSLRLKADILAPVSRTYVKALRAEGWF